MASIHLAKNGGVRRPNIIIVLIFILFFHVPTGPITTSEVSEDSHSYMAINYTCYCNVSPTVASHPIHYTQ